MSFTSAAGQRLPNYYEHMNNFKPVEEDGPNLHDDCPICYVPLGENEEDVHSDRVSLAKGEHCKKHYFHDLCLAKWVSNSKNGDCPVCRQLVGRVTLIDMPAIKTTPEPVPAPAPRVPVMPAPQPLQPIYQPVKPQVRPQPQPQPVAQPVYNDKPITLFPTGIAERLVRGTASVAINTIKWGGRNAWDLTKAGFNWVMSDTPVADNHFDKRSITLLSRPATIVKSFEARMNDIRDDQLSMNLALISSTAAAGTHRKGEESIKRIEQAMNLLDAQLRGITEEFKNVLVEEKRKFS